ncbi:hypothetical protein MED222_05855 [Vibrio sp. MED222]|nr:hypothetical protein MED222_05855 [Vibrio sp. MED222]
MFNVMLLSKTIKRSKASKQHQHT